MIASQHDFRRLSHQREIAISGVADVDLILGATNLHQDLHFSTFYLRASLSATTAQDYPGYSFILAIYEEGIERYFIAEHEAEHTAKWLINRCVSNPSWLAEKLNVIEKSSRKLAEAFPDSTTADSLRRMSTEDLVAIYHRHNSLHSDLYRYARIPETLDRGLPFFSNYLRAYLEKMGVTAAEMPTVFEELTTPQRPSVIAEEKRAFDDITADALGSCPELLKLHTLQMFLPSRIREALRCHRERWGWLSYHGYRKRALPTEDDYARRLCHALMANRIDQVCDVRRNVTNIAAILARIRGQIDAQHKELFCLYSEIGRVKLLRRYLQLRNFYFLDLLLAEFAYRLNASEWEVRCCFPEEMVSALYTGYIAAPIKRRLHRCGVIYSPNGEFVLDKDEIDALLSSVRIKKKTNDDPTTRYGMPACVGFAHGRARIVGRSGDDLSMFQNGEVLICMAADPDLIPMIRQAAAVVTQQGGVNSHASILCREIGVPTVIGVEDLLDFIHDGDEVEVDATRGVVRLISKNREQIWKELVVPQEYWDRPERVGRKAANLQLAIERGFKVPPYVLLSFEDIVRRLDEDEEDLRSKMVALSATLNSNSSDTPSFLLRSSALDEDGEEGSRAGTYVSVPFSMVSDPIVAIREFVERNHRLGYRGVAILQRFLAASVSGVSVDSDPLAGAKHKLIVEFVRGSLNTVTAGQGQIERFVYDRMSGEIITATGTGRTQYSFENLPTGDLVEWLSSVGRVFGMPTYTEWGYFGGNYWLYQVRGAMC